eukprot:CAMPEP_0194240680 /NCGR_PEP_ID=MMETSP0158-20130606/6778_1 /TAXON_ID=33649 /ORGANISM="Thalassionema nitzschioides, Strain L26-B" /LENGTH=1190 /DNA_ID=CAMNT_0038975425 /DNA_START=76 /DNA_END=3648 /DNA_ORIENTATION=+
MTVKLTADEYDRADAVMDYLKNHLGRNYVTLIHTTDLNDHAAKVLDWAAKKHAVDFTTEAVKPPFSKTEGAFSMPNAMQRIIDSGYRTIIVAIYTEQHWPHLVKYADEAGLTGKDAGYFWMSWDTTDLSVLTGNNFSSSLTKPPTDPIAREKMFHGMGTMNMLDPFARMTSKEDGDADDDPFLTSWRSQNASFVQRLNELNPMKDTAVECKNPNKQRDDDDDDKLCYYKVPDTYFEYHTPSLYSSYIYDSIISIGLGACKARQQLPERSNNTSSTTDDDNNNRRRRRRNLMVKYPNTGTDNVLFNDLVHVEFEGASGSVILHNDDKLYNRNPKTISFGMYNLRRLDDDDDTNNNNDDRDYYKGFDAVLTSYQVLPSSDGTNSKTWSNTNDPYLYADGTVHQPPLKTPIPEEPQTILYLIIGFICTAVIAAIGVHFYVSHKRKQADSVWSVDPSELKFHRPPEVIGQGTFGLVVLAEYRGTQVAVKRVLPVGNNYSSTTTARRRHAEMKGAGEHFFCLSKFLEDKHHPTTETERHVPSTTTTTTEKEKLKDTTSEGSRNDIEAANNGNGTKSGDTKSLGFKSGNNDSRDDTIITGTKSSTFNNNNTWKIKHLSLVLLDTKQNRLQTTLRNDFIAEMRYLSKLRHPCVTTVMGAVITAAKHDGPMLVMEYMDHGSLHDLLHNDTLVLDGDLVLPILRDIAQGLRFLHAATPKVIHGDLKAANVLVDSKFRAKVADFGLSQKKRLGATGTPYWMAPELLRRESSTTAASDIYSFGIILYEVYSRKDPYEGERYTDVISMIADPLVNKRPPVPPSCPKSVATLMQECVKGAAEFRPSAEELDKELKRLDVASAGPIQSDAYNKNNTNTNNDESEHALLYELLPKHVADVLRSGGKVEPESRDLVTIFFSDIVGFTNISSELEPIQISDLLDRLYHKFDALSQKHDVFKVETIGDAYMAVTNLIKDQPDDHAKRIAGFAIDAILAANGTLIDTDHPERGFVNIRVGFHSGPVVANVVGTRSPRYCLFGDAVNTASRMESNSKENRIHCSARAAGLLLNQWPELQLEHRGRIKIKGKGEMRTFWVSGPAAAAPRHLPSRRVSAHQEGSIGSSSSTKGRGGGGGRRRFMSMTSAPAPAGSSSAATAATAGTPTITTTTRQFITRQKSNNDDNNNDNVMNTACNNTLNEITGNSSVDW